MHCYRKGPQNVKVKQTDKNKGDSNMKNTFPDVAGFEDRKMT